MFTTVCIDRYGKVYDLSIEHPSFVLEKKNKGKKNTGFAKRNIVDAFTCTIEECARLKARNNK